MFMPIDLAAARALSFDPIHHTVDRRRLQFFAKIIGEGLTVYTDLEAARAQGFPDLPVPPTFLFGIELERPEPFGYLAELGVDMRSVLHGEQSFEYETLAFAGDSLTVQTKVVDAYHKRNGELQFLVKETDITRNEVRIAISRSVVIVRDQGRG